MNGNQQSAVSSQRSAPQAGSSTVSSQQSAARLEGEQDARHVMGAVPIILAASVLGPLFMCAAAVLVWLFR